MSEFLAEARILVRPDTTRFRAQLQEEVNRAISQTRVPPVAVPIAVGTAGLAAATAATGGLTVAQESATAATLGLATAAQVENTAFGRQAAILQTATVATEQKAGADIIAARAATAHSAATANVGRAALANAASLTGLRGAVLTAGTAFLGATVAIQAFAQSVQSAARTETELNVFRQTALATATDMRRVREEAAALGRDVRLPGVAAADAAEAMTLLAKAGLDVQDSIAGARGVLQLATAAQIENGQAAEFVANALNAFQLSGERATNVADLLAGAAQASQGSVNDIGIAFQQVAGAVAPLGVSLEDTIALLTLLAKGGLAGSDAGTALRVAILNLVSPTDKAREALDKLNIAIRDQEDQFRPESIIEFANAIRDLSAEEEARVARIVFGQSAIRAFNLIQREGLTGLEETRRQTNQLGLAQDAAQARTEGFAGTVEGLSSNLETAGGTIGRLFIPFLDNMAGGLSFAVGGFNSLTGAIEGFISPTEQAGNRIQELAEELEKTQKRLVEYGILLPTAETEELARESARLTAEMERLQGVPLANEMNRIADAMRNAAGASAELTVALAAPVTAVQDLSTEIAVSEAAGDENATLRLLRERERRQAAFLEKVLSRPATQQNRELAERAARNLEQTRNEIQAIVDRQASDAAADARDAATKLSEADQSFIEGLRLDESRRRNAVIRAQSTARLDDDLAAQVALRNFYRRLIVEVRETVNDAKLAASIISGLIADQLTAEQEIRRLQQEQARAQREAAEEARARREESLELDIELAETTGNQAAQERAIRAYIAFLDAEIKRLTGVSNKEKRLRIERARRIRELKELTDETKDQRTTVEEFFFEQLQAQQGFAANLLGNLIPRDQTAGLVGVPSPTGLPPIGIEAGIGGAARAAEGRSRSNPTAGQVSTTNDILLRILDQLKNLNRAADSPEAIYQRKQGSATMTGGGGNVVVM